MITIDDLYDAMMNEIGFCTNCVDFTTSPVKPKETNMLCEQCDCHSVFGARLAFEYGYISNGEK